MKGENASFFISNGFGKPRKCLRSRSLLKKIIINRLVLGISQL
ncbi:hypothetical protein EV201_0149 [Ancylomarina subtilis]|uniref:Uncharacterized protein n=1 Tax=Ancylomarina subtilis TaxID=1639035 RepID=A0A4Q7VHF5_9BACT|nr:hypothetical protein EV201_0149 [Ancylomarina subtilis]